MSAKKRGAGPVSAATNAERPLHWRTRYERRASFGNNIREAKRRLPLPDLMRALGDSEHARKTAKCPFHEDTRNSFSVFEFKGEWFWKCHAGCGHGDGVDYLKAKFNLITGEAIGRYCELAGAKGGGR